MDRETIFKCIELTENKYQSYYEEAKRVGTFDIIKEGECVRACIALKELKDELLEMWYRAK